MNEELKPCPHCGETPNLMSGMGEWWVYCKCQEARATRERAIEDWNKRIGEERDDTETGGV